MKWNLSRSHAVPEDGRSFIESGPDKDQWYAYETGPDGRLLPGFPKQREQPFPSRDEAQAWVEENIPPRAIPPEDPFGGDVKIVWADDSEMKDLRPWVEKVLKAIGYGHAWVSAQSCLGDFPLDEEDLQKARTLLGVELDLDDYVFDVARRLRPGEPS